MKIVVADTRGVLAKADIIDPSWTSSDHTRRFGVDELKFSPSVVSGYYPDSWLEDDKERIVYPLGIFFDSGEVIISLPRWYSSNEEY